MTPCGSVDRRLASKALGICSRTIKEQRPSRRSRVGFGLRASRSRPQLYRRIPSASSPSKRHEHCCGAVVNRTIRIGRHVECTSCASTLKKIPQSPTTASRHPSLVPRLHISTSPRSHPDKRVFSFCLSLTASVIITHLRLLEEDVVQ